MINVTNFRADAIISHVFGNPSKMSELQFLSHTAMPAGRYSVVWSTMMQLHREGQSADMVTVADRLSRSDMAVEMLGDGWAHWLTGLCSGQYFSHDVVADAKALIERHQVTQLKLRLDELLRDDQATNADFLAAMEAVKADIPTGRKSRRLKFRELREKYPTLRPAVIDGIARVGDVINFISKSKEGKSWSVAGLLLSVLMGWKWLNTFQTVRGKVLVIDNELDPTDIGWRIEQVARAMGIQPEDYDDGLEVVSLRGDLCSIFDADVIFDGVKPGDFNLIVVDALYRMLPEGMSENDNAGMTAVYNQLAKYAAYYLAALTVIHHGSKGDQTGKDITDVGSGAGAQSRAADAHLIIRPHEEDGAAVLDAKVRTFAQPEPLALRWAFPVWQVADDLDPAALKRQPTRQQANQESNDRDGCGKIVEHLRQHQNATSGQVRKHCSMGLDRANRLLRMMADDGRLKVETITHKGNECELYSLSDHLLNI